MRRSWCDGDGGGGGRPRQGKEKETKQRCTNSEIKDFTERRRIEREKKYRINRVEWLKLWIKRNEEWSRKNTTQEKSTEEQKPKNCESQSLKYLEHYVSMSEIIFYWKAMDRTRDTFKIVHSSSFIVICHWMWIIFPLVYVLTCVCVRIWMHVLSSIYCLNE